MEWILLIFSGLLLVISFVLTIQYGGDYGKAWEFLFMIVMFIAGIIALFFERYLSSTFWLLATSLNIPALIRAFQHRHDKNENQETEEEPATGPLAEIRPFRPENGDEPPNNAA